MGMGVVAARGSCGACGAGGGGIVRQACFSLELAGSLLEDASLARWRTQSCAVT